MSTAGLTDELVAAAQAGDAYAVREIYYETAGTVCGYLRAKGVADPEGLTSDVFMAVLPKIGTVIGGAAGFRRFLFSVAHARMVDAHRVAARTPIVLEYDPAADPRTVASAEEEADADMSTERVLEILDILPDDQREALVLRIVADLPLDQVAAIMHRSTGAVKQLQRRALLTVRQALAAGRVTLDAPGAMT